MFVRSTQNPTPIPAPAGLIKRLAALAIFAALFALPIVSPPEAAAQGAVAQGSAPGAASRAAASDDPVALIRKKDSELQKLLRDKDVGKKTDRIKVLINGIFDFEELGKRALGPNTWKSMTPDQQKRFVKAFRGMVENSSVKKLEVYQSDSTRYEPSEITDGKGAGEAAKASVTSHVFSKGTESIVTYKLAKKDTAWKAWDLVIDDLSTARNYGDQFRKILQTSNIEGLIARLEKKAAEGAVTKAADSMKGRSEKSGKSTKAAPVPAKAPAAPTPAKPAAPGTTAPAKKP